MGSMNNWQKLVDLAERLSAAGQVVTRIHCKASDIPSAWQYEHFGAYVHGGADEEFVGTTDGVRHKLEADK